MKKEAFFWLDISENIHGRNEEFSGPKAKIY